MTFEDALARSIDLLGRGAEMEECLALFPQFAAELRPLLEMALLLTVGDRTQLPDAAHRSGRASMAAHLAASRDASAAQTALDPSLTEMKAHPPVWRGRLRRGAVLPRPYSYFHMATTAAVILVLLLAAYSLTYSVSVSLPGDSLYSVKRAAEDLQGSLMAATGNGATWHAYQIERRLWESVALQARDGTIDSQTAALLSQLVRVDVQRALDVSAALPHSERARFLATWLASLRQLQTLSAARGEEGGSTSDLIEQAVGATIRTVETAAGTNPIPAIVPTATRASTRALLILVPTATPYPTMTPTATVTPTQSPVAIKGRPLPSPVAIQTATATATSSATAMPEPTATQTRSSYHDSKDDDADTPVPPTNTPMPPTHTPVPPTSTPVPPTDTPPPTDRPMPTATALPTAERPPVETPPTETPTTEPTPAETPTAEPPPEETPTPQPSPSSTPVPSDTPVPEVTPTAEPTSIPTALPSATSEQTAQPSPDSTPEDEVTP